MLPSVVVQLVCWLVSRVSYSNQTVQLNASVDSVLGHSFSKMCAGCAAVGATMYAYEATGELKGGFASKTREEKKQHEKEFFKQPLSTAEE